MWVFLFITGNFRISLILLCILYFQQFLQSEAIFLIHLNAHQLQPIRAPEALVIPLIHYPRFSHERDKRFRRCKRCIVSPYQIDSIGNNFNWNQVFWMDTTVERASSPLERTSQRGAELNVHKRDTQSCLNLFSVLYRITKYIPSRTVSYHFKTLVQSLCALIFVFADELGLIEE